MAWLTARDGCRNNFADVTGIKLSFIFVYNPMVQGTSRPFPAPTTWTHVAIKELSEKLEVSHSFVPLFKQM